MGREDNLSILHTKGIYRYETQNKYAHLDFSLVSVYGSHRHLDRLRRTLPFDEPDLKTVRLSGRKYDRG